MIEKDNPAPVTARYGVRNSQQLKPIKPVSFPQEPLLWQAHRESIKRYQADPTPVNRLVAETIARQWREIFGQEQCHV